MKTNLINLISLYQNQLSWLSHAKIALVGKFVPNVASNYSTYQLGDVHVQCAIIRVLQFIQIHEVVNVGPHVMVVFDVIQHTLCEKNKAQKRDNKNLRDQLKVVQPQCFYFPRTRNRTLPRRSFYFPRTRNRTLPRSYVLQLPRLRDTGEHFVIFSDDQNFLEHKI